MSAPLDCQTCGRCCFGQRDYVQVFTHDAERLGVERMEQFVAPAVGFSDPSPGRPAEPVRFMKMEGGHCAALGMSDGRFACTIYEWRPTLCRALQSGTSACLAARGDAAPAVAALGPLPHP